MFEDCLGAAVNRSVELSKKNQNKLKRFSLYYKGLMRKAFVLYFISIKIFNKVKFGTSD